MERTGKMNRQEQLLIESKVERFVQEQPSLACLAQGLRQVINGLMIIYRQGGKLLVCGNGGSAADSQHIVGELMKDFAIKRPLPDEQKQALIQDYGQSGDFLAEHLQCALPTIALTGHFPLISAIANDIGPDLIFAQQVLGYGLTSDSLLAISTSGESVNVLYAAMMAKQKGLYTIGLTGQTGGQLVDYCDVCLAVPEKLTDKVQEQHIKIYHFICRTLEQLFFGQLKP